ncbi:sugar diacid recognition domain-containing protein [Rhodococcoides kyotonense]|uniref:Carbohydrate diacid regulator n=1 Tax=Rhodococcoides kyotonense TaxID=398843 RepID=A0A239EIA0_9NOCA|nr:sugar diacid recognition domain-containing protein [Rhodococcus kyotonensis]SNS44141.1 carbohydrate diacid regulator [Rhodococcus kyotonensis]
MLSAELAQRVVDQVRPVVAHNVNIMDHRGIIIASADPTRLGTSHDGAIAALESRDIVRIERDREQAKAGVNVPLVVDGDAVGVVGVTGKPSSVEPLARVVVLTVTLLLRQEQQLNDSHWRESTLKDLLNALISEPRIGEARVGSVLSDVGRPSQPPWSLLAAFDTAGSDAPSGRLRASIAGLDHVVGIERSGVTWFLIGRAGAGVRDVVLDRLQSRRATVVAGRRSATTQELAIDARRLDIVTRAVHFGDGEVHDIARFDLEILLGQQADELSIDSAYRSLEPLSGTLRHTAAVVLDHDLSVVASATALHAHRNTVVQRLNRIQSLTGLDLRRFDDAVTMRIALTAESVAAHHDSA